MDEERALSVVEQKEVVFYDDEIVTVRVADGTVYVPIRPICEALGISWNGQRERILRDPILSEVGRYARVIRPYLNSGREQVVLCLPLDYLNGWLFGITVNRVKTESLKERVLRYQRDCYRVLNEAFREGRLTTDPMADFDDLLQADSPAAQAYKIATALMHLAKQQLILENRVETKFQEYDSRLETIEATLGDPARNITPAQASQISQAVKAIALYLSKENQRNEYGGVYGELYRRFEITSYKQLPARKFDEAIKFLTDWYVGLTGVDLPF